MSQPNTQSQRIEPSLTQWWEKYERNRSEADEQRMRVFVRSFAPAPGQHGRRDRLIRGLQSATASALVDEYEEIGYQYLVVGDGSTSVVGNKSGTPYCAEVTRCTDGSHTLTLHGYPRLDSPLGALFTPFLPGVDRRYLNSGEMASFDLDSDTLNDFLQKQEVPVIENSTLTWSHAIGEVD
jgi:hypothetical protein